MIIKTRLGALVAGTLAREPEIKTLGTKDVLVLNVKAQSEKDDAGRWKSPSGKSSSIWPPPPKG